MAEPLRGSLLLRNVSRFLLTLFAVALVWLLPAYAEIKFVGDNGELLDAFETEPVLLSYGEESRMVTVLHRADSDAKSVAVSAVDDSDEGLWKAGDVSTGVASQTLGSGGWTNYTLPFVFEEGVGIAKWSFDVTLEDGSTESKTGSFIVAGIIFKYKNEIVSGLGRDGVNLGTYEEVLETGTVEFEVESLSIDGTGPIDLSAVEVSVRDASGQSYKQVDSASFSNDGELVIELAPYRVGSGKLVAEIDAPDLEIDDEIFESLINIQFDTSVVPPAVIDPESLSVSEEGYASVTAYNLLSPPAAEDVRSCVLSVGSLDVPHDLDLSTMVQPDQTLVFEVGKATGPASMSCDGKEVVILGGDGAKSFDVPPPLNSTTAPPSATDVTTTTVSAPDEDAVTSPSDMTVAPGRRSRDSTTAPPSMTDGTKTAVPAPDEVAVTSPSGATGAPERRPLNSTTAPPSVTDGMTTAVSAPDEDAVTSPSDATSAPQRRPLNSTTAPPNVTDLMTTAVPAPDEDAATSPSGTTAAPGRRSRDSTTAPPSMNDATTTAVPAPDEDAVTSPSDTAAAPGRRSRDSTTAPPSITDMTATTVSAPEEDAVTSPSDTTAAPERRSRDSTTAPPSMNDATTTAVPAPDEDAVTSPSDTTAPPERRSRDSTTAPPDVADATTTAVPAPDEDAATSQSDTTAAPGRRSRDSTTAPPSMNDATTTAVPAPDEDAVTSRSDTTAAPGRRSRDSTTAPPSITDVTATTVSVPEEDTVTSPGDTTAAPGSKKDKNDSGSTKKGAAADSASRNLDPPLEARPGKGRLANLIRVVSGDPSTYSSTEAASILEAVCFYSDGSDCSLVNVTKGSAILHIENYVDEGNEDQSSGKLRAAIENCDLQKRVSVPCNEIELIDAEGLESSAVSGGEGDANGNSGKGGLSMLAIGLTAVGGCLALLAVVVASLWVVYRRNAEQTESSFSTAGPMGVPESDESLYQQAIVRDIYGRGDFSAGGPTPEAAEQTRRAADLREVSLQPPSSSGSASFLSNRTGDASSTYSV